jgi:molybdopterin synthase sulfur carrier subunit
MEIRIKSFAGFRNILGKEGHIELKDGAKVEDLLGMLCSVHGELRDMLFDEAGLKDEVNILVNSRNIAALNGIKTELADGDDVALFPAAIGG